MQIKDDNTIQKKLFNNDLTKPYTRVIVYE